MVSVPLMAVGVRDGDDLKVVYLYPQRVKEDGAEQVVA